MMPQKRQGAKGNAATFAETARKLGCDESEAAFDDKLRRIAKAKPQPARKKKAPAK